MRRPRRPIARCREGNAGHDASRIDIAADQNIQIAFRGRLARDQVQLRILSYVGVSDELCGITFCNRCGHLCQVAALGSVCLDLNFRVARNIERVIAREFKSLSGSRNSRRAVQADEAGFVIVVLETDWSITSIERDSSIVQVARGGVAGRYGRASSFALVSAGHEARFRRNFDWS